MATFNIFYSYRFCLKEITFFFFFLNLQIIAWVETYRMAWALKDTMTVFLWRVYSLEGEGEIQINNGDTMQYEMSSPGHIEGWGRWEKVLREGDIWDLSEFEDVGERKGREMVG